MITKSGPREGARLRPGQARLSRARRDRLGGAHAELARGHPPRRRPRHPRLHVAGAGRGPPGGRAVRRLLVRRRALRDAHGPAALRRGERAVAAVVDPARHAAPPAPPAPGGGPPARGARRSLPGEGPRRAPGFGTGAGAGARGAPRARLGPVRGTPAAAAGVGGRSRARPGRAWRARLLGLAPRRAGALGAARGDAGDPAAHRRRRDGRRVPAREEGARAPRRRPRVREALEGRDGRFPPRSRPSPPGPRSSRSPTASPTASGSGSASPPSRARSSPSRPTASGSPSPASLRWRRSSSPRLPPG